MLINMVDKYETVNRLKVKIYAIHKVYVHGAVEMPEGNWVCGVWRTNGKTEKESKYNLVKVFSYGDLKIDDKVLVSDSGDDDSYVRRHFSGVSAIGDAMTWVDGKTSFTIGDVSYQKAWKFCEKYIEDVK
jgi:hypothetical protein